MTPHARRAVEALIKHREAAEALRAMRTSGYPADPRLVERVRQAEEEAGMALEELVDARLLRMRDAALEGVTA